MRDMISKFRTLTALAVMSVAMGTGGALPSSAEAAADFVVYSVYQGLNMGNPGEVSLKDYYVNVGTRNGVKAGSVLTVLRRTSSYDLGTQKLYKDVTFPIARIKVIHAEEDAAIARIERFESEQATPAYSPRAIMVGDLVRPAQ